MLPKFVPSRIELMNIYRNVVPDLRLQPAVLIWEGESWVVADDEVNT